PPSARRSPTVESARSGNLASRRPTGRRPSMPARRRESPTAWSRGVPHAGPPALIPDTTRQSGDHRVPRDARIPDQWGSTEVLLFGVLLNSEIGPEIRIAGSARVRFHRRDTGRPD